MPAASLRRNTIQEHIEGPKALSTAAAERALLGLVMADAMVLDAIEAPRPEQLYDPLLGRIWAAVLEHHGAGTIPDPALLDGQFEKDEAYVEAGGILWLLDLIETRGANSQAAAYATAIREAAGRRELLRLARSIATKAEDPEGGALPALLAEVEQGASAISNASDVAEAWLNAGDMISGALERAKARRGIIEYPLGVPEVDRLLGGLHPGEMTIGAARPGMGKTVAAMAYAKAVAGGGKLALFFSLEMGADPMALRLACDLAFDRDAPFYLGETSNITADRINRDELSPAEWERIAEAQRTARRLPIRFDTRPGHTLQRIEALARRKFAQAQRAGVEPGLVVIDHLGKTRPGKDRRGNMHAEMADRSGETAEMAKRLGVPVLALVQLNRGVESQEDKRPQLSHLRQAGELEEDARQVVFFYRPEYYLRPPLDPATEAFDAKAERETKLQQARNKLFWIVEKNSHGPRGEALTFCDIAASAVREWRS